MIVFQEAWGWPAALYLFLGGLAAGTFVVASLLLLFDRKEHERAVSASYWISTLCLAGGLLALSSELGRPERGVVVWESFSNGSSWMTFGAWGAMLALVVFLAASLFSVLWTPGTVAGGWAWPAGSRRQLRIALAAGGSVFAAFVSVYAGMLLKCASGIPFWDSWLLPALFATSAAASGANMVAGVLAVTESSMRSRRNITAAAMTLILIESALLAAYLLFMLNGGTGALASQRTACTASAELLVSGKYAVAFWVSVVLTGLVASSTFSAISCILTGSVSKVILAIGSASALTGECALRFLILMAGMHADYVATFLTQLV